VREVAPDGVFVVKGVFIHFHFPSRDHLGNISAKSGSHTMVRITVQDFKIVYMRPVFAYNILKFYVNVEIMISTY